VFPHQRIDLEDLVFHPRIFIMRLIAIYGDQGLGDCMVGHPLTPALGSITTFNVEDTMTSWRTLIGGRPISIKGTQGLATCGHFTTAVTASTNVEAEGIGVHRHGDIGDFPAGTYDTLPPTNNTNVFAN